MYPFVAGFVFLMAVSMAVVNAKEMCSMLHYDMNETMPYPLISSQEKYETIPCSVTANELTGPIGRQGSFMTYSSNGEQNYADYTICRWRLISEDAKGHVAITFDMFDTECGYDYLTIYDGEDEKAPIVAKLCGFRDRKMKEVIISSGTTLFLQFEADGGVDRRGFHGTFTIVDSCGNQCTNHGDCNDGKCTCRAGFSGKFCEKYTANSFSRPSYLHSSIYDEERDCLWVMGGRTFSETYDDLIRFDFQTRKWTKVKEIESSNNSAVEYTMVKRGGTLYILEAGSKVQFIAYSIVENQVELLQSPPSLLRYARLSVVQDRNILVVGGSNYYTIFSLYSIEKNSWFKANYFRGRALGSPIVYHKPTKSVYLFAVHGGQGLRKKVLQISIPGLQTKIIDETNRSIGSQRTYSNAVLVNDQVILYGGTEMDTVTENSDPNDNLCFYPDLIKFDLNCYSWSKMNLPNRFEELTGRMGHSTSFRNQTLVVFGGQNGEVLGDLMEIPIPPTYSHRHTETEIKCRGENWCNTKRSCHSCTDMSSLCGWCMKDRTCVLNYDYVRNFSMTPDQSCAASYLSSESECPAVNTLLLGQGFRGNIPSKEYREHRLEDVFTSGDLFLAIHIDDGESIYYEFEIFGSVYKNMRFNYSTGFRIILSKPTSNVDLGLRLYNYQDAFSYAIIVEERHNAKGVTGTIIVYVITALFVLLAIVFFLRVRAERLRQNFDEQPGENDEGQDGFVRAEIYDIEIPGLGRDESAKMIGNDSVYSTDTTVTHPLSFQLVDYADDESMHGESENRESAGTFALVTFIVLNPNHEASLRKRHGPDFSIGSIIVKIDPPTEVNPGLLTSPSAESADSNTPLAGLSRGSDDNIEMRTVRKY